jgi:phosphoribosylaminoimidazole-succinocarboxamide synthase
MANGFQGQEGQKVPEMTPEVVAGITDRYIELYEHITGEKFEKVEYSEASVEANITSWINSL